MLSWSAKSDDVSTRLAHWLRASCIPKNTRRRTLRQHPIPLLAVRPCGADHQWRRVSTSTISIGSGSWRAACLCNWLGWSLATKVAFGRLSDPTGRNAGEA